MPTTYEEWRHDWATNRRTNERLGQAFVNDFIEGQWPELFYETDVYKSDVHIHNYLVDLQYYPYMPA